MNRQEFEESLRTLNDYDLYELAKKMQISKLMGINVFSWKIDLLRNESNKRHKDIFESAVSDAFLITASKDSGLSGIGIKNVLRPSLMSRNSIRKMIDNTSGIISDEHNADIGLLNKIITEESDRYFLCKVSGDSMVDEGIIEDDLLLVDKQDNEYENKIIVAFLDELLFVKRYKMQNQIQYLVSANKKYKPYQIMDDTNFRPLGVVKMVIKSIK